MTSPFIFKLSMLQQTQL